MMNIGVLALQGSYKEHIESLSRLENVCAVEVKKTEQLNNVSGLIIPGGESTTIGKLLRECQLEEPIREKVLNGMPLWGTCAGMIIIAKEITNASYRHLGIMDIAVRRNAYGGQLDSFSTKAVIPSIAEYEIPLVFIRAPWIERVWGNAEVVLSVEGRIAAARQGNMLATSFHPELTEDLTFHRYFLKMVREFSSLMLCG
ncbi:MAG: pyridoxal 5'-phosphate synthase glutaminase subunit PdxT [Clostridiaceae bacterium]|nr:pyridoxal 5'-phosphate synthase glutaminase subunit PdxT [Clostridiaceae bacterium]